MRPSATRAVLLLAAVLAIWNAWGYDLWAPDEPYFGEGAREMIADGEWVVPHVNGEITTDKPPLFFWLIALLSWPFGSVSALTARLPSILAFLGTVALTMRLGRGAAGGRAGTVAGLVFATLYLAWDKGRTSQIDATLCFFVTLALSAFAGWRARGEAAAPPARAWLESPWVFWGALGCATLAKGPVGLLVPLGIALLTLAVDGRPGAWRRFAPVAGPLLMLAIPGLWIVMTLTLGPAEYSVAEAFRRHVLERGVSGMHHPQPPYYFLYTMPQGLMPWTLFLPGALWLAWRRRDPADRLLIVWLAFTVVFFSIWREKRDLYVLPAYPAAALLISRLAGAVAGWGPPPEGTSPRAAEPRPWSGWVLLPAGSTALIFVAAAVAIPRIVALRAPALSAAATPTAAVVGLGGLLVLWQTLLKRPVRAMLMLGGATAAVYLTTVTILYPAINPLKSAAELGRRLAAETPAWRGAGGRPLAFGLGNTVRQIAFYSDGIYPLEVVKDGEFIRRFDEPAPVWAVVDGARFEEVRPRLRSAARIVATAPLFDGPVHLIVSEPPVQ